LQTMGKIKNGDAVHLVSVSGSNEGKALHSNMAEGDGLSFGSLEHEELGWVLDMDRTSRRKAIRASDVVHLRPCGYGDGMSADYFFHSNAPEGGMMSGGGRNPDVAWWIEGENKHIRDGDVVAFHAIADAHDESDRGPYMHSNGEEGGGFSFGGDDLAYGWQLCKIDGWDTSRGGKKVKNGSYIHLESVDGPNAGSVLHSNMEEGSMLSFGSHEHSELGWRIIANDEDASKIRYGMEVQFQGMGTGTFMHCNAPEGGPFSGGIDRPNLGFVVEGGGDGDKVRYGDVVALRAMEGPHDDSDRGPYMHSNGEEGGGFSWGGDDVSHGWMFAPNEGWSSSSD